MHNLTCVYYTKGLGTRLTQNSNKWMGELSKAAKIGRLSFVTVSQTKNMENQHKKMKGGPFVANV